MAAGKPGILIDHAAEQVRRLGIGALPQRVERAGRGDDRVVVHAERGGDVGQSIGHAGAAGEAVDQALGPLQHAGDDALGAAHLPQDVGVDPRPCRRRSRRRAGPGRCRPGWRRRPVPHAARAGCGRDRPAGSVPVRVVAVGIDRAEGADAARGRPVAAECPSETATPLPPSTSGSTSTPPIRIAFSAFMTSFPIGSGPAPSPVSRLASGATGPRRIGRAPFCHCVNEFPSVPSGFSTSGLLSATPMHSS